MNASIAVPGWPVRVRRWSTARSAAKATSSAQEFFGAEAEAEVRIAYGLAAERWEQRHIAVSDREALAAVDRSSGGLPATILAAPTGDHD